jgi:hypothetical protein
MLNRQFIKRSNSMARVGAIKRQKLTIGTIALAWFVILGFRVSQSAQAPAQQGELPEVRVALAFFHRWSWNKTGH